MMQRRSPPLVRLLLLNALLCSLLLYEVVTLQQQAYTPDVSEAMALPLAPELMRGSRLEHSLADYAEVTSRPLFNKERRPLAKSDAGVSDEDAKAFSLVGVVLTPEQQVAIIYSRNQGQPVKVALWEWIDGWRLISVVADTVQLKKGSNTLSLSLQRTSNAVTKPKQQ